jgi:hypothetical protein
MRLSHTRRLPPVPALATPVFARLHRVWSTGLSYGELQPGSWYPVERQSPRTLWLVTPQGILEVARQDFEVRDGSPASPLGGT